MQYGIQKCTVGDCRMEVMDIRRVSPEEYPTGLAEIPQPPKNLFVRGTWPAPHIKRLAVVGSRALSPYGRDACTYLIKGLRGYPISIVSGLALGTDACAHEAALAAGLHTIAVPGSGLDDSVLYPRTNVELAKQILKSGGLLLSEHDAMHRAAPHDFPARNRIMVGMSDAVLVIEAGVRSGTLITARMAHEYNRDLLCVPHRINDAHGFGASLFIRLGAALVSEPAHILEALGIQTKEATEYESLHGDEKKIYDLLAHPLPRDEVIRIAGMDAQEVRAALVMLELKGLLKEEFGAWRRI